VRGEERAGERARGTPATGCGEVFGRDFRDPHQGFLRSRKGVVSMTLFRIPGRREGGEGAEEGGGARNELASEQGRAGDATSAPLFSDRHRFFQICAVGPTAPLPRPAAARRRPPRNAAGWSAADSAFGSLVYALLHPARCVRAFH
jgi:hypothetical protein